MPLLKSALVLSLILMMTGIVEGIAEAKPSKRRKPTRRAVPSRPDMAIGINLGWEATYGNGVSYHYMPWSKLDLNGGVGMNNSGLKLGGGGVFLMPLSRSFGFRSGAHLVYSGGSEGEVALEATFTPEDSGEEEAIMATKTYEVDSAMMFNTLFGVFLGFGDTQIIGDVTYNMVLSGNDVTVSDKISYSRGIEATNQEKFEKEFDEKAKDKAEAGGLGFNVGLRFLF